MILIVAFWIVSIIVSISAFMNAGASAGLSALGASFLAFFGGSGFKAMFYGTASQKLLGVLCAVVTMAIAHWLGNNFSVGLFGTFLTGYEWAWAGFFTCLIFTPRSMIPAGRPAPAV